MVLLALCTTVWEPSHRRLPLWLADPDQSFGLCALNIAVKLPALGLAALLGSLAFRGTVDSKEFLADLLDHYGPDGGSSMFS